MVKAAHVLLEAERFFLRQLDPFREDAKAGPVGRARHVAAGITHGDGGGGAFQGGKARERAGLWGSPRAEAAAVVPRGEVGVGLVLHRAAHMHLPAGWIPIKQISA